MKILHGIAEDIGFRPSMEDAHAIWDIEEEDLFSAEVYDGHAGSMAAYLAAEVLTPQFLSLLRAERTKSPDERRRDRELLREAYLATDAYVLSQATESGTAAATLHVFGDRFLAANAGDTRVVMGTAHGAIQLTLDHKPHLPEERSRIEALGGRVVFYDVPRVQGMLAMSRALGDPRLKPYVSAEPRVVEGLLAPENDFAIVACDGVWDVLKPGDVISMVRDVGEVTRAAERVVTEALASGSTDNVTVIVCDLRQHTAPIARDKMEILAVLDRANV
jgi:serine/threonine protein phosphatase PrpC